MEHVNPFDFYGSEWTLTLYVIKETDTSKEKNNKKNDK